MKANAFLILIINLLMLWRCGSETSSKSLSVREKKSIFEAIDEEIQEGLIATLRKDIHLYMSQMPEDFLIYDESGEIISREKQREYILRDWSIIDTTLSLMMRIDSIQYLQPDSVYVYTYQEWERMMFRQDGVTRDTVLTNQRHKETWKHTEKGWFGYEIVELGGQVFINGKSYQP